MSGLKLSRYLVVGDKVGGPTGDMRIVMSTRSGKCVVIPESAWRAMGQGLFPDSLVSALKTVQVLVPEGEDELASVVGENQQAIFSSRELLQIIQPSAACQLACGYCGQEHRQVSMGESIQSGLLRKIEAKLAHADERGHRYEAIRIGWFGAEPLLALPVIRSLTERLRALAISVGCDYSANMVTNGLGLNLRLAKELQEELAVRHLEVTLDGPARVHDLRRFTKSGGRGTFSAILKCLRAIAREPEISLGITLRCNVDGSNADSVPELIEFLADEGLHQRCSLYFAPVHAWGNDADQRSLNPADFALLEVAWLAQMVSLGYEARLIPQRHKIVCMSVRPDSRVTDADGNEYNCTEVPYVPAYGTPNRYKTGQTDLDSDLSDLYFSDFNEQLAVQNDLPCHSCPHLPVCGGACPKAWADGTDPCPSFKLNAPQRITLHVASAVRRSRGTSLDTIGAIGAPSEVI